MNRSQRRAAWISRHRQPNEAAAVGSVNVAPANALSMQAAESRVSSVSLNVGEIVFRGFDKRTAARIASTFEQQMTGLLANHPVPAHWISAASTGVMRMSPIRVSRHTDALSIGEKLARSLFTASSVHGRKGGEA